MCFISVSAVTCLPLENTLLLFFCFTWLDIYVGPDPQTELRRSSSAFVRNPVTQVEFTGKERVSKCFGPSLYHIRLQL